jgi:hypothetical protein
MKNKNRVYEKQDAENRLKDDQHEKRNKQLRKKLDKN